ncbi:DMT family transporter [Providencia alcalifaciens]|uniref:DMT family transporter n=1 Tax=Providencia alcalifaciens TaxID=126385 RepID=UPI0015CFD75E|nr:DMT family transporter [Providencia alcalifaciens]MBF0693353.1 DMT family transporter [Providencia alcalifaciens]NYS91857.1 DMT family transporter [Providencia alcalifaciens]
MQRIIVFFLFAIVTLTWGTTWLAMKIAGESIPPLFATGLRFLSASPFLFLLLFIFKKPVLFPEGQRLFQLILCLFYFAIPFALMIYGELYVNASLAAIIFSTMPVFVLVSSMILLKEAVNLYQIIGLIVALTALVLILINESIDGLHGESLGIIALLSAVILHAVLYTKTKKLSSAISVLTFNALPCLGAGILLTVSGWWLEQPNIILIASNSIYAVVYLGVFAGVFGIMSYFLLQKKATPFQASMVFLIFPLVAIALDTLIYHISISNESMLLLLPLGIGIFLLLHGNTQKMKSNESELSKTRETKA